jgi:hypothetical protein
MDPVCVERDDAFMLARGLRAALDETNSAK